MEYGDAVAQHAALRSLVFLIGSNTPKYIAGCVGFISRGITGADRIANIGDVLDIDVIWDGFDIVKALSRNVSY